MEVVFVIDKTDKDSVIRFHKWVAGVFSTTIPNYDQERDWKTVANLFVTYKPSEFDWDELGDQFPVFCGAENHKQFCSNVKTKNGGIFKVNDVDCCLFPSVGTVLMLTNRRDGKSVAQRDIVTDLALSVLANARGEKPFSTMTKTMYVLGPSRFEEMIDHCKRVGEFCFDFETKPRTAGLKSKADMKKASLDFNRSIPTMLGISFQVGSGWILPLWHHQSPWDVGCDTVLEISEDGEGLFIDGEQVKRYNGTKVLRSQDPDLFDLVVDSLVENIEFAKLHGYANLIKDYLTPKLDEIFADHDLRKVAHNVKFDYKVGKKMGLSPVGPFWDTLTMDHYIQEDREHGLKDIANRAYPEFGGYEQDIDYANADLIDLGDYCAIDNDLTLRLSYLLERELANDMVLTPEGLVPDGRLYRAYRSLEVPKCAMLCEMEYGGMKIDRPALEEGLAAITTRIAEKQEAITGHKVVRRFVAAKSEEIRQTRIDELNGKIAKQVTAKLEALQAKTPPKEGTKGREKHDRAIALLQSEEWFAQDFPYKQIRDWADEVARIEAGEFTGFEFNLGSAPQLAELIYTHSKGLGHRMPMAMATRKDKVTGKSKKIKEFMPSTNKDYLQELEDETGIIADLMALGVMETLRGTYLQGIADTLDYDDCTHSSFSTVKTHRLSSSNPNLQNIPSRTKVKEVKEAVANIKRMFIPHKQELGGNPVLNEQRGIYELQPRYRMFQADLSQAELRWAAEIWQVRSMKQAFRDRVDLHILASTNANGMTFEQYAVKKAESPDWAEQFRFEGKANNFGLIFKATPKGYQEYAKKTYGLNLTLAQAEHHHRAYFQLHPDVLVGHSKFLRRGQKFGYVRTKFGVKRHTPNIHDPNPAFRSADERVTANSPIQGSSGQGLLFSLAVFDTIRMPMLLGKDWRVEARLTNSVHDSAVGWSHIDLQPVIFPWLVESMNNPPTLPYFGFDFGDIMMVTDMEEGPNWKDLKKINVQSPIMGKCTNP